MRWLSALRAVLWSFLGIRRKQDAAHDLEASNVGTLVLVALLLLAALVGGIALFTWAITNENAPPGARASIEAPGPPPPTVARHGPVRISDTLEERLRACVVCHGSTTQATKDGFSPRIAGKPAGYLFNQLVSFRDGRRTYPPMVYLVQYMDDRYLREIADYFARLQLPYPPPQAQSLSAAASARARQLIEHGDPARGVPACSGCHGSTLSGTAPAIPGLLGLPREYITAQFGAWRGGRVRSLAPDCMSEVARRLAPGDPPLLAAWLAAQPVPSGMAPGRQAGKLPLECGSVEALLRHSSRNSSASASAGRGAYLVAAGDCIACHTSIGGAPFAGGRAIATPFGTVYSSNITPDAATGIGSWSREDFWRALHEGRSKDGRSLYPAFPYPNFTRLTREDVDAIYDYLRSVPPVSRANTPHALRFPYSTQAALWGWRALFFRRGEFVPDSARGAQWNRGAYLVRGLGHCDACHASRNIFGAVSHSLDLGGGLIPMQNWYAPPLASARGAGIAGWDANEVAGLLMSGTSLRGTAMGPMGEVVYRSTQHLSPEDARSIAAYVRSLAPQARTSSRQAAAQPKAMQLGAAVYGKRCAECHGDDGEGASPAYPALAGNPSATNPVAANAIKAVLNGGFAPVTQLDPRPYGMPPFFSRLSDEEVAAVLTYVRASWGNEGAPVSEGDVDRYR